MLSKKKYLTVKRTYISLHTQKHQRDNTCANTFDKVFTQLRLLSMLFVLAFQNVDRTGGKFVGGEKVVGNDAQNIAPKGFGREGAAAVVVGIEKKRRTCLSRIAQQQNRSSVYSAALTNY